MAVFYRPDKAVLGDVIPFHDNGVFKPFFLRSFRANRDKNHADSWVMLTTTDHVHFEAHDTHIVGGTGSVIKVGDLYHMFYCTFQVQPERNYINHAVSEDLIAWKEIPDDRFCSDDEIYAPVHFRDPFVFRVEEEQCWWMIFAAQKNGPTTRRGCVGLCKSTDLHHWIHCQPLYAPMDAQCAFECPDLFKWGKWYYLVFSSYADRYQTLYRMSRSLSGPWLTPELDTFDTRAFYAAKTGSDGRHRYIYGWNPTREGNEHCFDPQEHDGYDCNTWDWGGTLIVHELWQDENGFLFVKPVDTVLEAFGTEEILKAQPLVGDWKETNAGFEADTPYAYAGLLLNPMKETSRLSMDVDLLKDTAQFGVALHVDENFTEGYYICIDLNNQRAEFKTSVRMTERGGQKFPYEIELERPLQGMLGRRVHIDICADGTVLEAYIDNRLALGTRMYDVSGGHWGAFVSEGCARFENIHVFAQQSG